MVDNVVADPGALGATFATDEVGGIHYPWNKLAFGPNDTITKVTATVGLPVKLLTGTAEIGNVKNSGTFAVQSAQSGTWDLNDISGTISLPTGASTAAKQLPDGHNVTTDNNNIISTDNSTTSTLTSASTFTGTGEDVSNYSMVTVQLDASHDSAVDGMTFQFSTDNTNWDDIFLFTYTAANGARRFEFPTTGQFFRIVYTNGGTGQTHFRVQSILHVNTGITTVHRLCDDVHPDRSSQLTKAAIIAQAAGTGDFVSVQATTGGNLKVAVEEFDAALLGGGVEAGALLVTMASDSSGLLSVDDNGGSLTVDNGGTFAVQATQAGTWNINDISGTVSLPTGAATAAKQLANGHDVTIDNAAAGAAVNIQDGGNSITVDNAGSFAVDSSLQAGTALVGKVSIDQVTANANEVVTKTGSVTKLEANTGVDIGDVDVTSQPARVATTDNVGAAIQTNQIMDGTTSLTPKFAAIDVGGSGDNTLVAAVGGKKIRVLQVTLIATAAVNVRFESDTAGSALTGQMALTTNSGFEASFCPVGLFETVSGELLNLELSSAIPVDGWLVYVEV